MTEEEVRNGLGRTIVMSWGIRGRIIAIYKDSVQLDFPELRTHDMTGKLRTMPMKKVYFNTSNRVWNLSKIKEFRHLYITWNKKFFKF